MAYVKLPLVVFVSIDQIRAHQWVGNAYHDGPAFGAIDGFVRDESRPMADRAEALRVMTRSGMGLTGSDAGDHLTDDALVAEYINSL